VSEPRLRLARPEDVPAIEKLLTAEWLPPFLIADFLETFWVLENEGGAVVGSAGLEIYSEAALLRSVVVAPSLRGTRQGERLTRTALDEAQHRGVKRVYLFTLHAAPFFARFGFQECTMDDFEASARQSSQYRILLEHLEVAQVLKAMRATI
jgi:amino-acid N-acetyltransferase